MKGLPLLSMLLGAALVFSCYNDNHAIRTLPGNSPDSRARLSDSIDEWKAQNCTDEQCKPFVVVATAGGGIRAAYWTGTVLGHLHQAPVFSEQLFAISGVSGGSVGATVYRSLVSSGVDQNAVLESTQDALAHDYLGPLSAALLYRDIYQRFVWWDLFTSRAETFEKSLEESTAGLSDSFIQLNYSEKKDGPGVNPWPNLFLNSTWSDNGRRIVAAGLKPDDKDMDPEPGKPRILYKDLLNSLGTDMPRSTAAHNSARFPYVSPPGSWEPKDLGNKGIKLQRLQDGGLFENFGAETALEILQTAQARIGKGFNPLVILISSDPSLSVDLAEFPAKEHLTFGYEVLSTPLTLIHTRTGRGAEAAARLQRWAKNNGAFAYFRMCGKGSGDKDERSPPLGWALSKSAQCEINRYLLGKNIPDRLECPEWREENPDPESCPGNPESLQRINRIRIGNPPVPNRSSHL